MTCNKYLAIKINLIVHVLAIILINLQYCIILYIIFVQTVFRITREEFKQFSGWRQTDIKKRVGLF